MRYEHDDPSDLRDQIATLQTLVADLSDHLTDEGCDWTPEGLDKMRRRVAAALPHRDLPEWLKPYRPPETAKV